MIYIHLHHILLENPKRNFDSETMTSFNNIDELMTEKYAGNYQETSMNNEVIENMRLEVDDSKNILRSNLEKINDREDKLQEMQEKSKFLMESAEQFKRKSRTLYYYMFVKYFWHTRNNITYDCLIVDCIIS